MTRYDGVFESSTDSLFYQNLHHYFDLIEKTPELQELWQASEKEYAEKHTNIHREKALTEEEADEKEELTLRVERFNLYATGCTIYVRVYIRIEDYKNSMEPEDKQDPYALLMIRGIDKIKTKRWSRKTLTLYNRWFDGKRPFYEKELRQFHLLLLAELEKQPEKKTVPEPPAPDCPLRINPRTGDFDLYGVHDNFSPSSMEFKVLMALYTSSDQQASYLALLQAAYPHITEAT
ncbi:MAG TPA: hypothetical protein VMU27_01390, partial [Candidatus Paceibacterota bacterium]|nr:hypothetical protein [Candidatus Paceibacterota bacterium]